jgi:hypothetical protein
MGSALNEFVELLVSDFDLTRENGRTRLCLRFDEQTPCIWSRAGKKYVRETIPDFSAKAALYRDRFADFFAVPTGELTYSDRDFPFRYVSGGSLPVIKFGDCEYYCLIYRECFPVGWNLANGGSDTPLELTHPFAIVEREMREELVVLNPVHRHRYIFRTETESPVDMPEYLVARNLWRSRLLEKGWPDINRFKPMPMPIKWLDGPDGLHITMGDKTPVELDGCFLNIRAEDFGIEVDRIAKMNLENDVVLFDGELVKGRLVGSVVGLFEIQRMAELIAADAHEFTPDIFFYNGRRFDGSETPVTDVVSGSFVPRMVKMLPEWDRSEWFENTRRYDLCPVTRGILDRAVKLWRPAARPGGETCDVFISFANEDAGLAQAVFQYLSNETNLKLFFSRESRLSNYGKAIDDALENAKCLVAVGSSVQNLSKGWPEYEYRSFHMLMKARRKPPNAQLVSYLAGMDPEELPLPLFHYQAVLQEQEQSLPTLRQ